MNAEVSRRPGRPLGFDRGAVLGRLMTLFWQAGFDGVSQQQMAAATGLSTSSLYNTFGTKAEIFRAAMTEYLRLMRYIRDPLEHGSRGRADVLEMLDRVEAVLRGPQRGFGCMATTAMSTSADERIVAATREYRELFRAAFLAVLRRARDRGELTAEPAMLANLLTAAVLGTMTVARADPDGDELAVQLRALRDFVEGWGGVA